MSLTHYIFVRRDLPVGVIAAMVTHAAGESSVLYPIYNYGDKFTGATAVVLEAKSELHLHKIAQHLRKLNLHHVEIVESGGPYDGQFMAIGLVPIERTDKLAEYQTLKSCLDNQTEPPVESQDSNANETNDQIAREIAGVAVQGFMGCYCDDNPCSCQE